MKSGTLRAAQLLGCLALSCLLWGCGGAGDADKKADQESSTSKSEAKSDAGAEQDEAADDSKTDDAETSGDEVSSGGEASAESTASAKSGDASDASEAAANEGDAVANAGDAAANEGDAVTNEGDAAALADTSGNEAQTGDETKSGDDAGGEGLATAPPPTESKPTFDAPPQRPQGAGAGTSAAADSGKTQQASTKEEASAKDEAQAQEAKVTAGDGAPAPSADADTDGKVAEAQAPDAPRVEGQPADGAATAAGANQTDEATEVQAPAPPRVAGQPADGTPAAESSKESTGASEAVAPPPPAPEGSQPASTAPTSSDTTPSEPVAETTADEEPSDAVVTGDWPMWGGDMTRNMVNKTTPVSIEFDPEEGKNINWTGQLGSQTYGNPVVAGGRVYVGTNNGAGHRPQHPAADDKGVLLCFDEASGELLWQLTREKLGSGRVNDWPLQGICSAAAVVDNHVYVVTNRAELMCLDAEGFRDGENDGPYQEEVDKEEMDADVIWSLDMINEYGVFPHNLATSSPVVYEDMVYVLTSNGVDEAHLEVPSPRSPSFLAVNRNSGELVWANNDPFDTVLHGQWSSPTVGVVNGKPQVYFPGGDGVLRALDAQSGDEIWRFDLNPKETTWELGGRGSRNAIIATPVFYENSVILAVGQDPEHGDGIGHLWRIDATKTGDVSAELGEIEEPGKPNPNEGVIWHYGGIDVDGSITGEEEGEVYRRTMSTVAVADGLVIAPDLSGRVHCVDLESGERYWEYDLLAAIWGSPMVADGKIFLGDENGDLNIFELAKEPKLIKKVLFPSSIYSTPTIANGKMYISDRSMLYSIDVTP